MKAPPSFYEGDTLEIAKNLLGHKLVHIVDGIKRSGFIVEVEAYKGPDDKAAHSYGGRRTERTEVMFGAPGHAYVYLIYGMYHCFNIITAPVDTPQGVLIRALEPVDGIEDIKMARYGKTDLTKSQYKNLTNGPGKLCRALGITLEERGLSLQGDELYIELVPEAEQLSSQYEIVTGPRINIDYAEEAVHYPWRFYFKNHPFVSK
ncbi:3-methyladenine DNA glycosylase [Bacillus pseudomycoides]|jgi:DNA-3-methyladenine glycosylase|uniref:DNA-3-methyladenine glycosylase n=1 Tax=Bacillus pseudomycoides TaxID=64104 RepID=UPI000BEE4D9B|nr:DNA-3-methyladenine glycosylase [Bacillus pseudomycoides]MBD5798551.1 3-methyladenine DNA glycosylase [Bacillus pseudomycoides]MED1477895.1 DNA-3-methyladenine glycosylase [Bacillus pseudomycoides]PEF75553.1 3-methyladenine DNA glycosylase [Bacillus pseudomycoides]PEJ20334.1 3-methyladenine DNA glycosylase [Bacillus pseudomycoides]PEL87219.1 3-methyladenine DNA glycosylase [Bacillus pseudomycoides]